jgi:hypothetical protein
MSTTIAVVATLPLPVMGKLLTGWQFYMLWLMFLVLLVMIRFEYGDLLLEQTETEPGTDGVKVPEVEDLPDIDDL